MYRLALRSGISTARNVSRTSSPLLRVPLTRTTLPSVSVSSRLFSFTPSKLKAGTTDAQLASNLGQELQYEVENDPTSVVGGKRPEFIKSFESEKIWKIEDKDGHDEITLIRTFGNETIRLIFSISDLDASDNFPPFEDDFDEDVEEDEEQSKKGKNAKEIKEIEAPEEELEDEDEFDDMGDVDGGMPIRCVVNITKPNAQALTIETLVQDGLFVIDNVSYYPDAKLATELSAEADWKRRGLYIGPKFSHLDETVQSDFEAFIEERGLNSNLALFIPDLAEWKEQKEYTTWLKNVKSFIEA